MSDLEEMRPGNGRLIKEDGETANIADLNDEMLGGKGFAVIVDTAAHTPAAGLCFRCLHFVTQTVIAAYAVDASAPVTGSLVGVTFAAGTVIYGKFTSLELTSGDVLAYNGVL